MPADDRDWYRDFWRKRTGYVERAPFRMSAAEVGLRRRLRVRRAWRIAMAAAIVVEIAVLLAVFLSRR